MKNHERTTQRRRSRGLCSALGFGCAMALSLGANTASADFPENRQHLEDDVDSIAAFTEDQFNSRLQELERLFRPLFFYHGGTLEVQRLWTSPTVNAYARRDGDTWIIEMHGGLARRPEITEDGLSMVLCHEIGHHLGGYPFKGNRWSAAEGQADYYAAQSCARWLWWGEPDNADARNGAPTEVTAQCDAEWDSQAERDLCVRISVAALSVANWLAHGKSINFSTPNTSTVSSTQTGHPEAQCRLDTYFAGALCTIEPDLDRIPGSTTSSGRNSVAAELEAALYSCMPMSEVIGAENYNGWDRPTCWFKPQQSGPQPR